MEAAVLARFRDALRLSDMSQNELARRVGLAQGQLSGIFNGSKVTTFTEMVDLADALDLDLATVVAEVEAALVDPSAEVPVEAEAAYLILEADREQERGNADLTPKGEGS